MGECFEEPRKVLQKESFLAKAIRTKTKQNIKNKKKKKKQQQKNKKQTNKNGQSFHVNFLRRGGGGNCC